MPEQLPFIERSFHSRRRGVYRSDERYPFGENKKETGSVVISGAGFRRIHVSVLSSNGLEKGEKTDVNFLDNSKGR